VWQRVRLVDMPDAYARRVVYRCYLDSRKWRREAASLEALVDRPAVQDDAAVRLTILAALAELAPRTRAVVALRYWEDQSVEQTAEALGISTGTVKSMSARGLAQLRGRLGDFAPLLPDSVENR
jgi:RNA polymerase sigma factor (sigma-70 family)